ncbi:hypothetical protein UPYG_G00138830 [Umbra pygmaea]|uniref:PX domain-containing protein n=1 Tax=Umbra pygmaea TaxID=75934 RepID=A0ABD0WZB6_UMBPY
MIKNQEEDVFVAVRVQDPRIQNEGSWNSYVDFKIFLHTNSKSFTAKTSCVRRRYSEFVWLKKRMQKNTGLVPVPDLPGKSFFSFSGEEFLEKRRKGLQSFLDKVCSMTVCLSDSQLHLFLQTQLPVGHILDCVQGHTPFTVTEAILNYASSNRGWVQEEGATQEPILFPVPYESMESPAPHVPSMQCEKPQTTLTVTSSEGVQTQVFPSDAQDMDTLELVLCDTRATSQPFIRDNPDVVQVKAVMEIHSPVETGFKQNSHEEMTPEMIDCEEVIQQPGDCQQETSVEVLCDKDSSLEDEGVEELKTESFTNLITETVPPEHVSLDTDSIGDISYQHAGVHCQDATGLDEECVSVENPEQETHTDNTPETNPHQQCRSELNIHEETPLDGDSLSETPLEDLSPAEEGQESITQHQTMLGEVSNTNTAVKLENADETKSQIEVVLNKVCHEVTTQEVESDQHSTQEKTVPHNIEQIHIELDAAQEAESDKEINEEERSIENIETTSNVSSIEESDTYESANDDNAIQDNSDYMDTSNGKKNLKTGPAQAVCTTDILMPETNQETSHEQIPAKELGYQGTNGVTFKVDGDVSVDSCSAKTLERTSSDQVDGGAEVKDSRIQESNHLGSGVDLTDISTAVGVYSEASSGAGRNCFNAATNQNVGPQMDR